MGVDDDIEARFRTAGSFAESLKQGQFELFCQPIVPVDTGKVDYKYMEIFVRFREEEDKLIAPGSFFPVLEANHLTSMLDRWVVRDVMRWIWTKRRDQPNWFVPRVSVNLADDTLRELDFSAYVRDQLTAMKIPGERLAFEITAQQMVRHTHAAKQAVAGLKSLGCPCAVADFSGNEAAAKFCKEAGVQTVKLEGSLIRNIHKSPAALSRLVALAAACRTLGLQTIAEFVEERETLPMLRKAGVDFAQGFGIAKPGPLALIS